MTNQAIDQLLTIVVPAPSAADRANSPSVQSNQFQQHLQRAAGSGESHERTAPADPSAESEPNGADIGTQDQDAQQSDQRAVDGPQSEAATSSREESGGEDSQNGQPSGDEVVVSDQAAAAEKHLDGETQGDSELADAGLEIADPAELSGQSPGDQQQQPTTDETQPVASEVQTETQSDLELAQEAVSNEVSPGVGAGEQDAQSELTGRRQAETNQLLEQAATRVANPQETAAVSSTALGVKEETETDQDAAGKAASARVADESIAQADLESEGTLGGRSVAREGKQLANQEGQPTSAVPAERPALVEPPPAVAPTGAETQPAAEQAASSPTSETPLAAARMLQRLASSSTLQTDSSNAQRDATPTVDAARFVTRVSNAVRAAQQRDGLVQLRLSPPELGSLRIEITVQQGLLTAKLETENAAVRNILMDNLPALRERLAEQEIRIEKFDVDVGRDEQQQADDSLLQERESRRFQDNGPSTNIRDTDEHDETTPAITTSDSDSISDGGLDVRV